MSESLRPDVGRYDLCIVGAGYAGLNAAFVASQYLPVSARVLVLDKHQQAGGMWNDAYSYVRLHQPYRLFTAGNIPWTLGRERSYLASRDEVAAHLRHCFDVISKRFAVDARWGWEYLDHHEDGDSVVVTARGPDGEARAFRAERFIDAKGFDVEPNRPLALASRDVHSIAPRELENSGLLSTDHTEPVWVIGSGKTSMDTIVALVRANPARRSGMVTGTGTSFFNRDLITPPGLKRWTGGVRYSSIFAGAAKRFDGTNATEVSQWCRTWCGTSPLEDPPPSRLLFAFLSQDETATVATGVSEVIRDHLVDVVDELRARSWCCDRAPGIRSRPAAGSSTAPATSNPGMRSTSLTCHRQARRCQSTRHRRRSATARSLRTSCRTCSSWTSSPTLLFTSWT